MKKLFIVLLVIVFSTTILEAKTHKKHSVNAKSNTVQTPTQSKSRTKSKKSESPTSKTTKIKESDYYNGHKVFTGERGGRYYLNDKGKKVYISKKR